MTETTTDLPAIRGFLPSTLIDWPGRVASILFLPGCNLRCPYCHAADLLNPAGGEVIGFDQVRRFLAEKGGWIDGVVICGGEPTLHPALANLCRALRAMGPAVKLDTNGTRPEVLAALIDGGLLDAVSMDLKTTLDRRMIDLARAPVDLEAIDRSVDLLLEAGGAADRAANLETADASARLEVEFRTTCCPAFVDEEVVEWIARRIGPVTAESGGATERPGAGHVLQRFEPAHSLDPAFREMTPYTAGEMERLLRAARRWNPNTHLRGG
jgi:pyruvate formate lyase activating enzyme